MVKYKNKFKTAHSVKFYLFNVETSITKFNFFSEFEFNIKILPRSRRRSQLFFSSEPETEPNIFTSEPEPIIM